MIPSKHNINSSNQVSLSLPIDDYFSSIPITIPTIPVRGQLIKKLKHWHSQPHEENTIFPSRTLIQDSTVQSSVAFQYPLPLATQCHFPYSIKASYCSQACCLMLATFHHHLLPWSHQAHTTAIIMQLQPLPFDAIFIVMSSSYLVVTHSCK